jgi:outer membrane protein assembly factor BamB
VKRVFWFVAIATLLAGCNSLGKSNREPPTALKPIKASVEIKKLWSTPIARATDPFSRMTVALGPDRVYAGDAKGVVRAWNASTGKVLWETKLSLPLSGATGLGDGLVLVGSSSGVVAALEEKTGAVRWRKSISSEVVSKPVAAAGIVVVQAVDGTVTGLSAAEGSEKWRFHQTVPALSLRGTSHPVIIDNRIVASGFANGTLVLLDLKSGRMLHRFVVSEPRGRTELERLVDVDGTPLVSSGQLFAGSYQGSVVAIDARSGHLQWSQNISSFLPLDDSGDILVVVDEHDTVRGLRTDSGAEAWSQKGLMNRQLCAPTIVDDDIVVGDGQGYIHVLSLGSGDLVGRWKLGSGSIESVNAGPSGVLYVRTRNGSLAALKLKSK